MAQRGDNVLAVLPLEARRTFLTLSYDGVIGTLDDAPGFKKVLLAARDKEVAALKEEDDLMPPHLSLVP